MLAVSNLLSLSTRDFRSLLKRIYLLQYLMFFENSHFKKRSKQGLVSGHIYEDLSKLWCGFVLLTVYFVLFVSI